MTETTPIPKDEQAAARFQITDMQGVSWYLKKLLEKDTQAAALRAELETVTANYAAMLESIETDKRGLEFLYAAQVRDVARTEAERLKRKSVTTPYGVLAFREQPGALTLSDRQTCAELAHAVTALESYRTEIFPKSRTVAQLLRLIGQTGGAS